jgi:hypothetical protein
MKLKDFIINENLIDSKFDIERAVLNKSNSTVNIFIKIENVLSYEGYVSLENKVKDLTKVSLSLSKVNENTLNVKYSSGMMFLPNIEISLIITAIYSNKIELTYSCKPLMEIAVEKLLPKLISNLPKGVIEIENKTIKVDLEEIEQAKKVLKFLSLSDIVINDEIIEVFAELK